MATVYLYVLGASANPDGVDALVPWRVDATEIFFGPCKKHLREALRRRLLRPTTDRAAAMEEIFFVGFNASPAARRVRKIVWAGRLIEAMSFARAWLDLTSPRYEKLRAAPATPVHLEPLEDTGHPTAYRHVGLEHREDAAWLDDLLTPEARRAAYVQGDVVRLPRGQSWWDGFPRDVCFLFENLFFAAGAGLDIDEDLLRILRDAQEVRTGIGAFAVFGLTRDGRPDGRRGGHLEVRGPLADRLLGWLRERTSSLRLASSSTNPQRPGRC